MDANVDTRAGRIDTIALDSHVTLSEFKCFERAFGTRLKLAFSWFSEGTRLREWSANADTAVLSARERECLQWTAVGLTSTEIAERLTLAQATVNEHISSAARKLGASTRVQACARAALLGLATP